MNREIKFRGKSNHPESFSYGDFVFGSLIKRGELDPLINVYDENSSRDVRVDPNTIGQFTGLMDCKGREIFEGDIINYIRHRLDGTGFLEQGKVEWRNEEGCYVFVNRFPTRDNRELVTPLIRCKEINVIGNIHDNPELMEGGAQ